MKLHKNIKFEDKKKCYEEAIERVVELVQKWVDQEAIISIITFEGKVKSDNYDNIDDWLHLP